MPSKLHIAVVVVIEDVISEEEAVVGEEAVRVGRKKQLNNLQQGAVTVTSSFSNYTKSTSKTNIKARKGDSETYNK